MKYAALIFLMATSSGCNYYQRLLEGGSSGIVEGRYTLPVMGQSNMWWIKETHHFERHPRLILANKTPAGPGYYAALEMVKANPGLILTFVNCAEGGTSLEQHLPGTPFYESCLEMIREQQAQGSGPVLGLLVYIGETDARYKEGCPWKQWFESYVRAMRVELGAKLPVVFAQIGTYDKNWLGKIWFYSWWEPFKELQASIRIDGVAMIKTEDLLLIDQEHHGPEANAVIGKRFADSLIFPVSHP